MICSASERYEAGHQLYVHTIHVSHTRLLSLEDMVELLSHTKLLLSPSNSDQLVQPSCHYYFTCAPYREIDTAIMMTTQVIATHGQLFNRYKEGTLLALNSFISECVQVKYFLSRHKGSTNVKFITAISCRTNKDRLCRIFQMPTML